jgi:hypothetical protein
VELAIFRDIAPCSPHVNRRFGGTSIWLATCYTLVFCSPDFRPWRWRWYVLPQRLFTYWQHEAISQKTALDVSSHGSSFSSKCVSPSSMYMGLYAATERKRDILQIKWWPTFHVTHPSLDESAEEASYMTTTPLPSFAQQAAPWKAHPL